MSSCFNHLPRNPDGSFKTQEQQNTENAQAKADYLAFAAAEETKKQEHRKMAAADGAPPKPPAVAVQPVPGGELNAKYFDVFESVIKANPCLLLPAGGYNWRVIQKHPEVLKRFPNIGDQSSTKIGNLVNNIEYRKRKRDKDVSMSSKRHKG